MATSACGSSISTSEEYRSSEGSSAATEARGSDHAVGNTPRVARCLAGERTILRSITGFAVFLTAWEVLASAGLINAVLLPSPTTLFWAVGDLLRSGTLVKHVGASIERVLVGFALAALVGLTLGVVLGWFRTLSDFVKP
jgi:NitT/TauT family transport system permease protein